MRINEMTHTRVATDQDELLKCRTGSARFKKPEQTFHCHIHDLIWSFLAGGKLHYVRHTFHCFFNHMAVFNGAVNILDSLVRFKITVMTQGPNCKRVESCI